MTTPHDAGSDPDRPGERRGLESYPEFFAYPIDPDTHETTVMPRVRSTGAPPYQKPHKPDISAESAAGEGSRPPFTAPTVYPEPYIKDKASGYPAPAPNAQAPILPMRVPRTHFLATGPVAP